MSHRSPARWDQKTDKQGGIGLQIITGQIEFRNIRVRDLSEAARPSTYKNTLGMEFVIVPKGKSWLGGGQDKLGNKEVEIPADFFLGKYEVTQEEWEKVMGENPSYFSRTGEGKDAVKDISEADLKRHAVQRVSWDQCQVFVAKLNKQEKESGWVYRCQRKRSGSTRVEAARWRTRPTAPSTSTSPNRRTPCCRIRRTSTLV